jgi:hypothetical protein
MEIPMTVRLTLFLSILASPLAAQEEGASAEVPADSAPLFASHDVLSMRLEGPLERVFEERDPEDPEAYEAVLSWRTVGGGQESQTISLRTRGQFRLQRRTCDFPPLRVNFKKSAVEGTLFAGQDKLKLVTHCQDGRDEYEQYVLQEYLIYRMYNLFTEESFRVRLAQMTYVDSEAKRDSITKYAFFIEDEDAMAARNGLEVLEVAQLPPEQASRWDLVRFELFQFLIGNTDFDPFAAEPDDEYCCHNAVLIGSILDMLVIPVPYDFDWSGVISARYAKPAEILGIRSVRERRFWGVCRPREEWELTFPVFEKHRQAIYDLFRAQPDLDPDRLEDSLEYFDEFYEIIGDDGRVRREIESPCRGRGR